MLIPKHMFEWYEEKTEESEKATVTGIKPRVPDLSCQYSELKAIQSPGLHTCPLGNLLV